MDMSVQYVVDEKGKRTGVFLPIDEYEELLEQIEDKEAIAMLEEMKKKPLETRRFDDFLAEYSHDV